MEELKTMLLDSRLKPTYQRLKIIEYLQEHPHAHPTVEVMFEELKEKIPTISITTIYNNLNAFLEKGLVSAETITGTEVRYDLVTEPHHHFLCRKCGRIIDIDIKCPVAELKTVDGHRVEEVHGYFKGVCAQCLEEEHAEEV